MAERQQAVAYVSTDGKSVRWMGEEVAQIVDHSQAGDSVFGSGRHHWAARTPDGRTWHGTNRGPGMRVWLRDDHGRALTPDAKETDRG